MEKEINSEYQRIGMNSSGKNQHWQLSIINCQFNETLVDLINFIDFMNFINSRLKNRTFLLVYLCKNIKYS